MMYKTLKDIYSRHHFMSLPVKGNSMGSSLKLYLKFWSDYRKFSKQSIEAGYEQPPLNQLYPILNEAEGVQSLNSHYAQQPVWLFKKLKDAHPDFHVDIGSQLNMLGYLTTLCPITYIDIRKPNIDFEGLKYAEGSILKLQYEDRSIPSLSSLHVVEHIGLGRYGDPLDPVGHIKAIEEIKRVIQPGGSIYLSAPCGRPRVNFNAHRVFESNEIIRLFDGFELVSLSGIYKDDKYHEILTPTQLLECNFGCGFFHFKRVN